MAAIIAHALAKRAEKKKQERVKNLRVSAIMRDTENRFEKRDQYHDTIEEEQEEELDSDSDSEGKTDNLPGQAFVRRMYEGEFIQISVAAFIFINFVVNAAEAQVDENTGTDVFYALENFFTALFTVELTFNMYAYWFRPFWASSWNVFDFVVVAISLLSLMLDGLPGISTLRLLRAFRVFRLFKRLKSLRKILVALEAAVPGCANAFLILVLVSSIYSILGVEFFSDVDHQHFSTFLRALFTMFQIMTGDNWSEIAWPMLEEFPQACIFFVTYILIANIVLVNVIIAAILEEMVDDKEEDETEPSVAKENEQYTKLYQMAEELHTCRQRLQLGENNSGGEDPAELKSLLDSIEQIRYEFKREMMEIDEKLSYLESFYVSDRFDSKENARPILEQLVEQEQAQRTFPEPKALSSYVDDASVSSEDNDANHNREYLYPTDSNFTARSPTSVDEVNVDDTSWI
ncbi:hypothetical protein CYMTET_5578 [Cymbomonas tetramitiformis]|uniref:Ion transport domain-containing protein n=1 Tax=Cymbomonas tetramitiformis TaxID=36881 RepID=A0AAE0LJ95_9CHLO|nr:hypothetical protein CYMTET_5578 [Cymbomonas tetramitiformis]|eukprot:gene2832-3630_t